MSHNVFKYLPNNLELLKHMAHKIIYVFAIDFKKINKNILLLEKLLGLIEVDHLVPKSDIKSITSYSQITHIVDICKNIDVIKY